MTAGYARVAIEGPFDAPLTWTVPPSLAGRVRRGVRVLVPFRSSARTGVVMGVDATCPPDLEGRTLRAITDVLDVEPLVPEALVELCEWIARYYHASIGDAVRLALPPGAGVDTAVHARVRDDAPTAPPDDRRQRDLLDALRRRGGTSPTDLLVADVRGGRHLDLSELEASGYVVLQPVASGPRHKPRYIDRVEAISPRPEGRLGPKQAEILGFLDEHGESTSDELRDLFGTQRGQLRALESRGFVTLTAEEVVRDPFARVTIEPRSSDPPLTDAQGRALAAIEEESRAERPRPVLLHGVTGSGKTEVYLRFVRAAIDRGDRALILLPEIALTPQFVGVFRAALGDTIAVLHSGLTGAERHDQWRRIRRGDVHVVIGARSALFAPVDRLSVIVVDEEHDPSFKQDHGVSYHARDLAVVLAARLGAQVILGSATPSMESFANAARERYRLVELPDRVHARPMPDVELIDMRDHPPDDAEPLTKWVSPPLQAALADTVRAGEQAILFLNRRGYAPVVQCHDCGEVLECSSCDISLTYHRRGHLARCHYCGFSARVPSGCPTCASDRLEPEGIGTEQIEKRLADAFEGIRVGRLDADTARGRGVMRILDQFRRHEIDVLVGTQMVTKGHDFPKVTLVGVLNADQSLRFPDFRSGERTFQLLSQVGGRAGRAERPGRVLVQTWAPDHPVLLAVQAHDFAAFSGAELHYRDRVGYPPHGHMVLLRFESAHNDVVWRVAERVADTIRRHGDGAVHVLGPTDAPISRVKDRYRVHVTMRCASRAPLHRAVRLARQVLADRQTPVEKGVRSGIDIDPLSML